VNAEREEVKRTRRPPGKEKRRTGERIRDSKNLQRKSNVKKEHNRRAQQGW
jgi:hypothetical protein